MPPLTPPTQQIKKYIETYGALKKNWPHARQKYFLAAKKNPLLLNLLQKEKYFDSLLYKNFEICQKKNSISASHTLKQQILENLPPPKCQPLLKQFYDLWNLLFPKKGWYWSLASALLTIFFLISIHSLLSQKIETRSLEKQNLVEDLNALISSSINIETINNSTLIKNTLFKPYEPID